MKIAAGAKGVRGSVCNFFTKMWFTLLSHVVALKVTIPSQLKILNMLKTPVGRFLFEITCPFKSREQILTLLDASTLNFQGELQIACLLKDLDIGEWQEALGNRAYEVITYKCLRSRRFQLNWAEWEDRMPDLWLAEEDDPRNIPSFIQYQLMQNTATNTQYVSTAELCGKGSTDTFHAMLVPPLDGWSLIDGECLANLNLEGRFALGKFIEVPARLDESSYDGLNVIRQIIHRIVAIRVALKIGMADLNEWSVMENRMSLCLALIKATGPESGVVQTLIGWLHGARGKEGKKIPFTLLPELEGAIDTLWNWFNYYEKGLVTRLNLLALDGRPRVVEERLTQLMQGSFALSARAMQDLLFLTQNDKVRLMARAWCLKTYSLRQVSRIPAHIIDLLEVPNAVWIQVIRNHFATSSFLYSVSRMDCWRDLRRMCKNTLITVGTMMVPSVMTIPQHLNNLKLSLLKALVFGLSLPVSFHPCLLRLILTSNLERRCVAELVDLFMLHEYPKLKADQFGISLLHRRYRRAMSVDKDDDDPMSLDPVPSYNDAVFAQMAGNVFRSLNSLVTPVGFLTTPKLSALIEHFSKPI